MVRKAVLTCDTSASIEATPNLVKYRTDFRYEILQGSVSRMTVILPAGSDAHQIARRRHSRLAVEARGRPANVDD